MIDATVGFGQLYFYVMKRGKPTTGNQKDLFACVACELWKFKNKPSKNFKRQNQQLVL